MSDLRTVPVKDAIWAHIARVTADGPKPITNTQLAAACACSERYVKYSLADLRYDGQVAVSYDPRNGRRLLCMRRGR